jgi:hypothetical protein
MGQLLGVLAVLAVILLVALFLWRRSHAIPKGAALQTLRDEFDQSRDKLAAELLQAAAATGKPRGLRWVRCDLNGELLYVFDPKAREILALAAATISFAAIEGGGMEEVEAVGNLRSATAVFRHRGGRWTTDGRVVFNLEPHEAMERFGESLVVM